MHYKIKDLPINERPYEKFLNYGPKALTDVELLAILLRAGTSKESVIDIARHVLMKADGTVGLSTLHSKELTELTRIKGIGKTKAITLKCIAEISERISVELNSNSLIFDKPEIVADSYMERLRHLKREEILVVYLDSANKFIAERIISQGTVNTSIISSRDVFIYALSYEAVKIILIHNHPSGNPMPSKADIEVTSKIIEAGKLLDIRVVDHIIIGDLKYISFREVNLIDAEGNMHLGSVQ